jgi:hypothetical protein
MIGGAGLRLTRLVVKSLQNASAADRENNTSILNAMTTD